MFLYYLSILSALWPKCQIVSRSAAHQPMQGMLGDMIVFSDYREVPNIRRTKYQHLKYPRTALRLSLPNPLKPDF